MDHRVAAYGKNCRGWIVPFFSDLAVPVLERVPDAAPPLAVIVADATRAVGELPSPPIRSAPTVSSGMPSAASSSSRNHASLGVFTSP